MGWLTDFRSLLLHEVHTPLIPTSRGMLGTVQAILEFAHCYHCWIPLVDALALHLEMCLTEIPSSH